MTEKIQGMGLSDTLISQETDTGAQLLAQLESQRRQLDEIPASDELGRQRLQLSISEALVALEKKEEACSPKVRLVAGSHRHPCEHKQEQHAPQWLAAKTFRRPPPCKRPIGPLGRRGGPMVST